MVLASCMRVCNTHTIMNSFAAVTCLNHALSLVYGIYSNQHTASQQSKGHARNIVCGFFSKCFTMLNLTWRVPHVFVCGVMCLITCNCQRSCFHLPLLFHMWVEWCVYVPCNSWQAVVLPSATPLTAPVTKAFRLGSDQFALRMVLFCSVALLFQLDWNETVHFLSLADVWPELIDEYISFCSVL
jgi:hypothetical protein